MATQRNRIDQMNEQRTIDLNQASREELMQIPGIGPSVAERIIEFREQRAESHTEPPPDWQSERGHISEREFDEFLDRLYI